MKYTDTQSSRTLPYNARHIVRCLSAAMGIMILSACDSTSAINVLPSATSQIIESTTPATGAAQAVNQEVAFQFDFSAAEIDTDAGNVRDIKALSPGIMTGTMLIENIDTGATETRPWTIEVDDNFFPVVTSHSAMPIVEGQYIFTLSVVSGDRQYIGSTPHVVDAETTAQVPMTLRPVIGDTMVDVTVASSLMDFGFSYPVAELNAAGLIAPSIIISIDGGAPQQFALDPATGLSPEVLLVALPPGDYQFSMELFDGGYLLGKTLPSQETVTVSAGADVSLDIAPQYGSLNIDAIVEGEDAQIDVTIPSVVVDEVGGPANLDATLRVVGNNIPPYDFPLALIPDGADYSASAVIPQMAYGDLTFEMVFFDITRGEVIGNCIDTQSINSFGGTVNCPLNLQRQSLVTGNLLSTLGLNVFGSDGLPLPHTVVRIDGVDAGITGGTGLQTANYIELQVKPGQHVISAEFGAESGEILYDSVPLNVTSLNLSMGQTVNVAPSLLTDEFLGTQSGTASPVTYWFGCNGTGTPDFGFLNNGKLELWSQFNDPVNDFCSGTSAVTEHSFTDIEIINAGGFQVSADIAWSDHPTSNLAIGIGEEAGSDPFNFNPTPSLDAIVDVYDSEIVVRIFDFGVITSVSTYPMPITTAGLDNVTVDVQTSSFAAGSPATLMVYINGNPNFVPPIDFTWDGGSNHIEIRGGTTTNTDAMVALDTLAIRPR